MSSEVEDVPFPREKRERLIIILHPKRASLIFFYVFSVVLTIVGISFLSATAYGAIPPTLVSWTIGNGAIIVGIFMFTLTEMKRFFTLYIITTWNVRTRKGIIWRKTTRVFYDRISECRTTIYPDERRVGMGDVEIISNKVKNGPTLIFEEIENPEGIREIISRFMQTIPFPLPWGHIERD
ncbi:MAG: PH domain-containing protein [Candidatus Thorarchaeota archaeon]